MDELGLEGGQFDLHDGHLAGRAGAAGRVSAVKAETGTAAGAEAGSRPRRTRKTPVTVRRDTRVGRSVPLWSVPGAAFQSAVPGAGHATATLHLSKGTAFTSWKSPHAALGPPSCFCLCRQLACYSEEGFGTSRLPTVCSVSA